MSDDTPVPMFASEETYKELIPIVRNLDVRGLDMCWSFQRPTLIESLFFLPFELSSHARDVRVSFTAAAGPEPFLETTLDALDPRHAPPGWDAVRREEKSESLFPWLPVFRITILSGQLLRFRAAGCTDKELRGIIGESSLCFRGGELR